MLQIHGPGGDQIPNKITTITAPFTAMVTDTNPTWGNNQTTAEVVCKQDDRFTSGHVERNPDVSGTPDENAYVIMQPQEGALTDLTESMSKCELGDANTGSVFDDSDYDEVIDFMTSPEPKSNKEEKLKFRDSGCPDLMPKKSKEDDENSSKRSSSSSASSALTSSTSGIESGDERPAPKYADLDIAKILHTRKRIHRILQVIPDAAIVDEDPVAESPVGFSNGKKKSSYLSKRRTHYGTLGSIKNKSNSSTRRSSSNSRPSSMGDDLSSLAPTDFRSVNFQYSMSGESPVQTENYFLYDSKFARLRSKDSDNEEGQETSRNFSRNESKRWSRISTGSQNSDKAQSSPKGPWKAFRKFVNNKDSTRLPSHEEIKASIQLCHNNNNNNNNIQVEDDKQFERILEDQRLSFGSSTLSSSSSVDVSTDFSSSPSLSYRSPSHTNTLLRRLSHKSSSRGRIPRRKSFSSRDALDVRGNSMDSSFVSFSQTETSLPRFQYGDGSQKSEIERMVMTSVQTREEKGKLERSKSKKSASFKKRLMSFTKKRGSSQERKSIFKSKTDSTADSGQMNKAMSYSSPQLSVFAVNSGSNRSGLAQKLVF